MIYSGQNFRIISRYIIFIYDPCCNNDAHNKTYDIQYGIERVIIRPLFLCFRSVYILSCEIKCDFRNRTDCDYKKLKNVFYDWIFIFTRFIVYYTVLLRCIIMNVAKNRIHSWFYSLSVS